MMLPNTFGPGLVDVFKIEGNFDEFTLLFNGQLAFTDFATPLLAPFAWTLTSDVAALEANTLQGGLLTTTGTGTGVQITHTGGGTAVLVQIAGNVATSATTQAAVSTLTIAKSSTFPGSLSLVNSSSVLRIPSAAPSPYGAGDMWVASGELKLASSPSDPLPFGSVDGTTLTKTSGKLVSAGAVSYGELRKRSDTTALQASLGIIPTVTFTGNYAGCIALVQGQELVNNDFVHGVVAGTTVTGPSGQTKRNTYVADYWLSNIQFDGWAAYFVVMTMVNGTNTFTLVSSPAAAGNLVVTVLGRSVSV